MSDQTFDGDHGVRTQLTRELQFAALALAVGIIAMPCVIWLVGRVALGPYTHGGPLALWWDFIRGLGAGSTAYWFVALAPYLLLWALRAGRRLLKLQH